jgi:MFS family permease
MTTQVQTERQVQIKAQLSGMRTFFAVWFGQMVSLTGSSMTGFALGVWIFQQTGSATSFALTLLFIMLPRAILSPLAGVVADRRDRRWIMILTDLGAGVTTVATALLLMAGQLEIWHIYLFTALNSSFGAFQGPAFGAAVTHLVPKAQYGRANGLMQLGTGVGQIIAPVLAGVLMAAVGLQGVLLVDMATFLFAVLTLLAVRFPKSEIGAEAAEGRGSWAEDLAHGWRYLVVRPGLMGLVVIFTLVNFFVGTAEAVLTPMILSFTTPDRLGVILSVGGVGMLIGGVLMSIWGGGRHKVYAVFGSYALLGLAVVLAGLTPWVGLVTAAVFLAFICVPAVMGASQAIMQVKVAPDVQGRVFALRATLNTSAFAIAYLVGGPLADRIFEPLMADGGALAGSLGRLMGVGPGRGMGLMFVVVGVLAIFTAVSAFAYPRIRNVETELPDAV